MCEMSKPVCIRRMRRVTINAFELPFDTVLSELDRRLASDWTFKGGRILGSMCGDPHPVAFEAYQRYLAANIGDTGLVPGLVELEEEICQLVGTWWGRPQVSGRLVTGGTEANLLALWTAKILAREGQDEVILPESAHFSFEKAALVLDLKLKKIPVDAWGRADVEAARRAVNQRTLALVAIAGSTALGAVDSLPDWADLAVQTGLFLHIDASFGGFVLPFLQEAGFPAPAFQWREGYSSVALDPHKMGRGPIPSGLLLWKDQQTAQATALAVGYLSGGRTRLNTVVGTRSGASVAAVWAVLKHLGRQGYVKIVRQAMEDAHWFTSAVAQVPGVEPVLKVPDLNVVGVRPLKRRADAVSGALRQKGWALSQWTDFFRVVVMPHVTRELLKSFLSDLQEEIP